MIIGAGEDTVLFWGFLLPPLLYFFFGKREGTIWLLILFGGLGAIMLLPSLFDGYVYGGVVVSRFFIAFPILALVCYGLESSRCTFAELLDDKNRQLRQEKAQLIQAMKDIKTLRGLIPICARCKKVRNDDGYWEQVEVFLRARSEAEFSHGICPQCARTLYPDYAQKA